MIGTMYERVTDREHAQLVAPLGKCWLLLSALAYLIGADAVAQGTRADPCPAATTQFDLNECALGRLQIAESKLGQTYEALRRKLSDPKQVVSLEESQRAWASYREKQCQFETSATEGGSIHPMVLSLCQEDKTMARIQGLEVQLKCEEGDFSCVH